MAPRPAETPDRFYRAARWARPLMTAGFAKLVVVLLAIGPVVHAAPNWLSADDRGRGAVTSDAPGSATDGRGEAVGLVGDRDRADDGPEFLRVDGPALPGGIRLSDRPGHQAVAAPVETGDGAGKRAVRVVSSFQEAKGSEPGRATPHGLSASDARDAEALILQQGLARPHRQAAPGLLPAIQAAPTSPGLAPMRRDLAAMQELILRLAAPAHAYDPDETEAAGTRRAQTLPALPEPARHPAPAEPHALIAQTISREPGAPGAAIALRLPGVGQSVPVSVPSADHVAPLAWHPARAIPAEAQVPITRADAPPPPAPRLTAVAPVMRPVALAAPVRAGNKAERPLMPTLWRATAPARPAPTPAIAPASLATDAPSGVETAEPPSRIAQPGRAPAADETKLSRPASPAMVPPGELFVAAADAAPGLSGAPTALNQTISGPGLAAPAGPVATVSRVPPHPPFAETVSIAGRILEDLPPMRPVPRPGGKQLPEAKGTPPATGVAKDDGPSDGRAIALQSGGPDDGFRPDTAPVSMPIAPGLAVRLSPTPPAGWAADALAPAIDLLARIATPPDDGLRAWTAPTQSARVAALRQGAEDDVEAAEPPLHTFVESEGSDEIQRPTGPTVDALRTAQPVPRPMPGDERLAAVAPTGDVLSDTPSAGDSPVPAPAADGSGSEGDPDARGDAEEAPSAAAPVAVPLPPQPRREGERAGPSIARALPAPELTPGLSRITPPAPRPGGLAAAHAGPRTAGLAALVIERARDEDDAPTEFAALDAPRPKARPKGLKARRALAPVRAIRETLYRGPAPRKVSRMATEPGLPLDRTSLVGILDLSGKRTALLRLPDGTIRKIARGEQLAGWRVSAIGKRALRLSRSGRTKTLSLVAH